MQRRILQVKNEYNCDILQNEFEILQQYVASNTVKGTSKTG
jgi:hypothetical protein